jgi:pimeloyl-ACP methyl ester carboxylesterase
MSERPGCARLILRWLWRGLLAVLLLTLLVTILALIVETIRERRDAERFPPRGEMIDIGGRSLHLDCRGDGWPAVVIDAGAQDWSTGWRRPQKALARSTRVCTYDRAGLGWSDPTPEPHDGAHMVEDLHRLLRAAGVEQPVVLVGHSLGGMLNRIYYDRFPEDVAGMVLLEPGDPDQLDAMFEDLIGESGGEPALGAWVDGLASAAARLGLVRWMYRNLWKDKGYPDEEVAETRALIARPRAVRALASTMRHMPVTGALTRRNRSLGDIPLKVVYSSKFDEYGTRFESDEERHEFRAESFAFWNELVGLSSRGREPVMIDGANHMTMVRDDRYWPQVVTVILEIVDEVREASTSGAPDR